MIYNLLQIVQLILSAMDSDEVNSINDTSESFQVALMAQSAFYDMCVELNLPSQHTIYQLQASGDTTKPTLMKIPQGANIRQLEWIQYDNVDTILGETTSNYVPCISLTFNELLERQTGYRLNTQNVAQMAVTGQNGNFNIMYRTDAFPLYYATFDDNTIIFDNLRQDIESTLQQSKTLVSGYVYNVFTLSDTFTPPLEADQFSYFINKLKVRAFTELKQQDNKEAAMEARRQKIVSQKRKRRIPDVPEVFKVARYGRNSSFGVLDSILEKYGRNSV